jgi:tetratricopeptide (TPR) repeat protein
MKRKKKRTKKVVSKTQKSPELLLKEGKQYLEKKNFREAINLFKILIKKHDNQQCKDYLAQAYEGRARELIEKDMGKEALVMLEHMKSVCNVDSDPVILMQVYFLNGQYKEAIEHYIAIEQKYTGKESLKRLESIFAALILSGQEELLSVLPENHPLMVHRSIIIEAVEALSQGKDDRCRDLIQKISIRSPYKDYRLFLRGMISYYNGNEKEALSFFEKVSDISIIKKLAKALIDFLEDSLSLVGKESSFTKSQRSFLTVLRGHDREFVNVLDNITIAFSKNNYPHLFSQFRNYMSFFDETLVRRFCQGLISKNISLIRYYESLYGKISSVEYHRLKALAYERNHELEDANDHWDECLESMPVNMYGSKEAEKTARALIYRRIAANEAKLNYPPAPFMNPDRDYEIEMLETSLNYDPYDKPTYDTIIEYYQEISDKKNIKKWIDKLIEHFPEDTSALYCAAQSYFDRKAYKKSVSFLERILKIDPINKEAREKKIAVHITKARNDIEKKKFHLARKEFEAAALCGKGKSKHYGSTLIKWGTMELLAQDTEKGYDLLREGFTLEDSGIGAALVVHIESQRVGLSPSVYKDYDDFLKRLLKDYKPEYAMELVDKMLPYIQINYDGKNSDIKAVQSYLKKTLKHSFTSSELLQICLYLFMTYDFTLLKKYSERGKKQYPEINLFTYYFILGKCKGEIHKLTFQDKEQLEKALERAEKSGDKESASKIEMLLKQIELSSYFTGSKAQQLNRIVEEFLKRKKGEQPSMDDVYELLEEIEDEDELDDYPPPPKRKFPFF